MFNKAIILALLVGGLGIAVAGCEALYKDRNLFATSQPKTEAVEPKTETIKPKTEPIKPKTEAVISKGDNKPQPATTAATSCS